MNWTDIGILAVFVLLIITVMTVIFLDGGGGDVDKLKRNIKKRIASAFGFFHRLTHRPSPLQREIMQEEKEIKQLEKQKADMEHLDQLRERKERLWEEVSLEEGKPYKLIYNGTEINKRFETEEEAFNYAEACADNGLFSAQVERTD